MIRKFLLTGLPLVTSSFLPHMFSYFEALVALLVVALSTGLYAGVKPYRLESDIWLMMLTQIVLQVRFIVSSILLYIHVGGR